MTLALPPERIKELDAYLYVLGLVQFHDNGKPGHDPIVFTLTIINYWQRWFDKPALDKNDLLDILEYGKYIDKWEWYVYLHQKGYTYKQIADILGVKSTTVKAFLHRQELPKLPISLERWLQRNHETVSDLHGLREVAKIEEFVVPSIDFAAVLRQSI